MTRALVLASALLIGGAALGLSGGVAIAAEAKGADAAKADAAKKAQCERDATLQLYVGKEKSRFIAQCLASKAQPPKKAVAGRPRVHPSAPAIPRPAPLGGANPPATSTGSTAPSNAPAAPSTPVIGSSGTSTTGSSATSISGSSGSSLGSSGSGR
jgi:hypothetical protein